MHGMSLYIYHPNPLTAPAVCISLLSAPQLTQADGIGIQGHLPAYLGTSIAPYCRDFHSSVVVSPCAAQRKFYACVSAC